MSGPRAATLDVPYVTHPEERHAMTYYTWGETSAPPVLCVHGLTRNGRDFDFLAERLAQDFFVIAPDMPGRGESGWLKYPEEYAVPCYAANLLFLLGALKVGPVRWVGTSMGGIIGMGLAAEMPELVTRLVLNDIGPMIPASARARLGAYVGKAMQFASRAEGERALREIYQPFGIKSEAVWQQLFAHDLKDMPDGSVRRNYDPAIGNAYSEDPAQGDFEMWELWGKITCPVLLVRGEVSDILPADVAEKMQKTHPRMQVHTVPGVGHAPTLADGVEINLIQGWLKN